jgi:versiconal hemiacetal acetate esterase
MSSQAHDSADELGGDKNKIFCFGCSAGGTLSLATAHKLIELGKGDALRGVINCAGGAIHPDLVPDRFRAKYNAMTECDTDGVPVIDAATTRMVNSR